MPGWVQAAVDEYARRLPRQWQFGIREVAQASAGDGSIETVKRQEGESLVSALPASAHRIALDARGKALATDELAERLRHWETLGRPVTLMIGGPEGLHEDVVHSADECLSLSRLTFPHPLVRVILVEQLYRAQCVNSGHPYHRA